MSWLCTKDFIEILHHHEEEAGAPCLQACLDKFEEVLEDCELLDLGFTGDIFTWRNHHQRSDDYIKERLDRAVANGSWRARFPWVIVHNGDPHHSDPPCYNFF